MRRTLTLAAALAALAAGALAPAQAITNGEPDGDAHPYVGLLVAEMPDGRPPAVCSGSFLDARTFLTAGHCFDGREDTGWVEIRLGAGPLDPSVTPVGAVDSVDLHPQYDPADFSAHDLAVVKLDGSGDGADLDRYAQLPRQDELDGLTPSVRTVFIAVGYGFTRAPQTTQEDHQFIRRTAEPRLLKINHKETGEGSFVVSANSSTGGTCAGDSGGPVLLEGTDVVAGVVSYGKNALCGGQSGIYRVDRADDLDWLATFLTPAP